MKIAFTGGGTAGHAMANQVLISYLHKDKEDRVVYIGSYTGAERGMMEQEKNVSYYPISTGKLRRYVSFENIKDFFRVFCGIAQAFQILKKEEVNVVFSGGGFVSLPVILAARMLKIPVLIRETDCTVGLANRIGLRFAKKVFTTFPNTSPIPNHLECEFSGFLIRPELFRAEVKQSTASTPTLLIMGGSQGADRLNRMVWDNIESLSCRYRIIHLCGKGRVNSGITVPGYTQYEYCTDMGELYAKADVVITRCGSNAISEGLALGKRLVCIPISNRSSRGEQFVNARYAQEHGCADILEESCITRETLVSSIETVLQKPLKNICRMTEQDLECRCQLLLQEIDRWSKKEKDLLFHSILIK